MSPRTYTDKQKKIKNMWHVPKIPMLGEVEIGKSLSQKPRWNSAVVVQAFIPALSSRPARSIECILGQSELNREVLSQKTNKTKQQTPTQNKTKKPYIVSIPRSATKRDKSGCQHLNLTDAVLFFLLPEVVQLHFRN